MEESVLKMDYLSEPLPICYKGSMEYGKYIFNLKIVEGDIIMDETSIGIILPKRLWKQLLQDKKDEKNFFVFQYADTGQKLDLEVLFFNLDEILVNELKGEAFIIKEGDIIFKGSVTIPSIIYNPFMYHQKKRNRTIFELAKQTGVTIINEQNNIKKKPFLDLME